MTNRIILSFILFILSVPAYVLAKEPPTEPILRMNTKMHTAMIRKIDIDSAEKLLLTCSDDKTAILWDAKTGEYIKRFLIPIDEGHEGKIFSCAISPDGAHAAFGGWTGWDWFGEAAIYIFNTSSGQMVTKIGGMDNVVDDLEYSKDGRLLAAGLGESFGIRIVDIKTEKIIKKLTDYGSASYSVSWGSDGRLAAVSFDGKIRLYDKEFNLKKEILAQGGKEPFSIAISPDNKKIAVAYNDSTTMEVLDGTTLELLYRPDTEGATDTNNFMIVNWSYNGEFLYAGGFYLNSDGWSQIRKYSRAGQGKYVDIAAGMSSVREIKPLRTGGFITGNYQPDIARFDGNDIQEYYKSGEILDFKYNPYDNLRVNHDGTIVSFKAKDKTPYTFNSGDTSLIDRDSEYPLPMDSTAGVTVTDWQYSFSPKINDKSLKYLQKYERSRSVSVSKDGSRVLFGADWSLTCTDSSGTILWQNPVPGVAWAVNIAGDGKLAVVIYDDGTIRWHRMSDGVEIVALFVHDDMKRWVFWTPKGYYDASAGGDSLIGWHMNNGSDKAADFFSASRFASTFYRPDILNLALKYADIDKAILQANAARNIKKSDVDIASLLPPVVTIVSPESGTITLKEEVTITAEIKTPSSDMVTETKILVNGRPYEHGEKGLKLISKEGSKKSYKVKIDSGENVISILAKNKNAWSEPATLVVTREKEDDSKEEFVIKPRLYILAIGVSIYKDDSISLKYAAKDAKDFAEVFQKQKGLYRDIKVTLLVNEEANKTNILDGLDWIQKETTSKDVAIIYISGHGMNDSSSNLYYLPYDTNFDRLKSTGLPAEEISNTIRAIAGKVLYFMDTCHSGNIKVAGRRAAAEIDVEGVANELSSAENGAVVFLSSTGKQYSLENDEWNNGAFTKAIVEGLNGKADYVKKGKITINQLDLYLSERVKELTGGKQTPVTTKPDTVRDFPIVIVEGSSK